MNKAELTDMMLELNNKCRTLENDIYKERISAQPTRLEEMKTCWADNMVRLHCVIRLYEKELEESKDA